MLLGWSTIYRQAHLLKFLVFNWCIKQYNLYDKSKVLSFFRLKTCNFISDIIIASSFRDYCWSLHYSGKLL